jgi:hypothetical protein
MRRLFGTDETYYAVIFILVLIVNGGFALFADNADRGQHPLALTPSAAST